MVIIPISHVNSHRVVVNATKNPSVPTGPIRAARNSLSSLWAAQCEVEFEVLTGNSCYIVCGTSRDYTLTSDFGASLIYRLSQRGLFMWITPVLIGYWARRQGLEKGHGVEAGLITSGQRLIAVP